jgi:hypothetical protein
MLENPLKPAAHAPACAPQVGQATYVDRIQAANAPDETGGTGRFAALEGGFTVQRLTSGITFLSAGSFDGTIAPPPAVDWEARRGGRRHEGSLTCSGPCRRDFGSKLELEHAVVGEPGITSRLSVAIRSTTRGTVCV